MDYERWEELTREALRIHSTEDAVALEAFIAEKCRNDEEREEVRIFLHGSVAETTVFGGYKRTPEERFKTGDPLGEYDVVQYIDGGGQADVYRAHDKSLRRDVAIKVLPDSISEDDLERFEREAHLLAALNHPNIVYVLQRSQLEGRWCLIMEFVEGETLARRIARGPIPMEDILAWARQIAGAVESAHERGIVHRDLKPGNIMIANGQVKVLDFGLARTRAADAAEAAASSAGVIGPLVSLPVEGTIPYMSPEQLAGENAHHVSDVWSFGCVLYEMLTRRPAFTGMSLEEVEHKIINVKPDWDRLPADTPYVIRRLVERCLKRDKNARFKNIGDARLQIEDAENREDPLRTAEEARRRIESEATAETAQVRKASAQTTNRNSDLERRIRRISRREWIAWTAAAAGAVSFATVLRPTSKPERFATALTLNPSSLAISPDGSKIVFSGVPSDRKHSHLYLIDLNSPTHEPSRLDNTEGAAFPFWNPLSTQVGFGAAGKVHWVDVLDTRRYGTIAPAPRFLGGAWLESGDEILFGTENASIKKATVRGGQIEEVRSLGRHQIGQRFPQLLPKGRFMYYATGPSDVDGVWVDSLESGDEPVRLLEGASVDAAPVYTASGHLLFVKNGVLRALKPANLTQRLTPGDEPVVAGPIAVDRLSRAMAVSVSPRGGIVYRRDSPAPNPLQLEWFSAKGADLTHPITLESDAHGRQVSLSGNGRLAYSRFVDGEFQIAVRNTDRETSDVKRRELKEPSMDLCPIWSPDGNQLAFATTQKDPSFDLYIMNTDENPPTFHRVRSVAEDLRVSLYPTDWSRDGSRLLYQSFNRDGAQIKSVDVTSNHRGSKQTRPYTLRENAANGQFSPDSAWVAYQSYDNTGETDVFVAPVNGGEPLRVSEDGGFHPRWNPKNSELFYVHPDGHLMNASITGISQGKTAGRTRNERIPFIPPTGGVPLATEMPRYMVSSNADLLIVTVVPGAEAAPLTYARDWRSIVSL